MLRLAIVDDHPVARHGIIAILSAFDDLQVASSVSAADELPHTADGKVDADIILLDLYQADGRPALSAITNLAAQVPVLVVSASRAPADVLAAMQAGASGYLTKQASEEAYASAIRSVAAGGFYLSAQLADLIQAATLGKPAVRPNEGLSPREQQALGFIAQGFTHQQTATRMGVSKATVDTYVARIRNKLQLGNKAELALAALRFLPQQPDRER
jgi:DNA-binding NarL/FixJ family response regulator